MNKWTKKSIELANGMEYLDLLYDVYPIKQNEEREVQEDLLKRIKKSYNE